MIEIAEFSPNEIDETKKMNIQEMKSIRFPPPTADEEIRAILAGRKTVTRRVVKPQPTEQPAKKMCRDDVWRLEWWDVNEFHSIKIPYRPGDILYVRETFFEHGGLRHWYRQDYVRLL